MLNLLLGLKTIKLSMCINFSSRTKSDLYSLLQKLANKFLERFGPALYLNTNNSNLCIISSDFLKEYNNGNLPYWIYVHLCASTVLAPYLQTIVCRVPSMHLFGAFCIKFRCYTLPSKFKKLMKKQHLLLVLFGTKLVSNISISASKKHYNYYLMSTD